ncbi:MAG: hypothetical protein QOF84_3320 [Streptomyces sp.]|jgi:hypothetical protein|nr:hypothetical protein [Streptomyces sp.]MDX6348530.1 hypothetical protein [Streptomyces sp.]
MRIRATVAVLSGALALSALAVPAAFADESSGDTQLTKVAANGGASIAVGIGKKTFSYSVTATDSSGIADAEAFLWHGTSVNSPDGATADGGTSSCTSAGTCTFNGTIDPSSDGLLNSTAGTWNVFAGVDAKDGDYVVKDAAATVKLLRISKLTADAGPEPVKKGKTLTVTGKLTRADWQALKYVGYNSKTVSLQFRPAGSSTYTTVKSVTTGTGGALKTTVTASKDGYWRFSFAGSSTTASSKATGDYVDVQ